jgi:hypothetical protein
VPGAKDQAVEFNTLSKSHNMAGWRVGMAVGNERAVGALGQIKTNVDSGMFLAIQEAAIAALTENAGWMAERNQEYEYRRDLFYELFNDDWGATPKAKPYLWRVRGYSLRGESASGDRGEPGPGTVRAERRGVFASIRGPDDLSGRSGGRLRAMRF